MTTSDCAADCTSAARHEEAMAQRQVQRHAKSHLEAERAINEGNTILVLSDRGVNEGHAPIPARR